MKGRLFLKHGHGSAVVCRSLSRHWAEGEIKEISFCAFFFFLLFLFVLRWKSFLRHSKLFCDSLCLYKQSHASDFGRQECMQHKYNWLWTRVQVHSQLSLGTTKIQIQISDAIISRHFQPFKGVAVKYAARTAIFPEDTKSIFIVVCAMQ